MTSVFVKNMVIKCGGISTSQIIEVAHSQEDHTVLCHYYKSTRNPKVILILCK